MIERSLMPPSRIRSSHIPKLKGHPTLLLASGNRLYPSLFGLKSKLAPPGGEHIKEYFFPEGTELGSCEYAFVRNEEVFGDDAEIFRPDRWIEASQEQKIKFRYTVDTIFESGKYQCLGKHIAFIELHKVFFEVSAQSKRV